MLHAEQRFRRIPLPLRGRWLQYAAGGGLALLSLAPPLREMYLGFPEWPNLQLRLFPALLGLMVLLTTRPWPALPVRATILLSVAFYTAALSAQLSVSSAYSFLAHPVVYGGCGTGRAALMMLLTTSAPMLWVVAGVCAHLAGPTRLAGALAQAGWRLAVAAWIFSVVGVNVFR